MVKVRIGEKRTERVSAHGAETFIDTGTVIWIHPEKRFYVVRFVKQHGSFCETYQMQ